MDSKDVAATLTPFFKSYGFKRKGCRFYKIENQIAFCVSMYRPKVLNPLFYVMPLYVPAGYEYLNFGKHLSYFTHGTVLRKNLYVSFGLQKEEEARNMVEENVIYIKKICETMLFPRFEMINSPEKLITYLNDKELAKSVLRWCCEDWLWYKMKAYTDFYLSDFTTMYKDIELSKKCASKGLTVEVQEKLKKEFDKLTELSKAPEEERRRFVAECIDYTAEHCFKGIKRDPYVV